MVLDPEGEGSCKMYLASQIIYLLGVWYHSLTCRISPPSICIGCLLLAKFDAVSNLTVHFLP